MKIIQSYWTLPPSFFLILPFETTVSVVLIVTTNRTYLVVKFRAEIRAAVTTDDVGRAMKHFSDNKSTTSSEADWIVLRLADVVLLYAEATLANGTLTSADVYALPEIIQIRNRAGLGALSGGNALQVIKDERKIKLAWEGHRWFDLVRWGDAKMTLDFTDDNYLLFPIPVAEVLATSGTVSQNPGY